MKTKNKPYAVITIITALILTILNTASLFFSYDMGIGYFSASPLAFINKIAAVLSIAFLALIVILSKGNYAVKDQKKPHVLFFDCIAHIASVLYIGGAILMYITGITGNGTGFIPSAALSILSLFSALFFILICHKKDIRRDYIALFSILLSLCSTAILAKVYFNMNIPMNSPNKIYATVALMCSMVMYLLDARVYIDRQRPRLHLFFSMASAVLGISFSASRGIYIAAVSPDSFNKIPLNLGNFGFLAIIFAFGIYGIARIFSFADTQVEIYSENRKFISNDGCDTTKSQYAEPKQ